MKLNYVFKVVGMHLLIWNHIQHTLLTASLIGMREIFTFHS
jgi:hypothetical protein